MAFSFVLFSPVNVNAASSNKDVILVLDTSLSMRGYGSGARDIFETVKSSVNVYIDRLQDGDRVTFVSFDEEVKAFPRVMLDDQNDKDILKKYISMTEAHGAWTHMLKMLQQVFAIAKTLSDENASNNEKREVVIVIMTDGIDDPPPGKEKDAFTLKDVAAKYSDNDWWIYVVNLSEMEKTGKISASLAQFRSDLQAVSDNTMILDGTDPDKAINEDMKADMDKRDFVQQKLIPAIAIILALVILAGLFIYLRLKKLQIKGSLEYWNHELLKPEVYRVDLAPLGAREIIVGRILGCNVKLRDYESRIPFSLKAKNQKGGVILLLSHAEGLEVGFKNKEYDGIVNNGDIFTASNFSFRYLSE